LQNPTMLDFAEFFVLQNPTMLDFAEIAKTEMCIHSGGCCPCLLAANPSLLNNSIDLLTVDT
jgi:hypothetical protein